MTVENDVSFFRLLVSGWAATNDARLILRYCRRLSEGSRDFGDGCPRPSALRGRRYATPHLRRLSDACHHPFSACGLPSNREGHTVEVFRRPDENQFETIVSKGTPFSRTRIPRIEL